MGAGAVVVAGVVVVAAGASTVKANDPSIGWRSPDWTVQRTPVAPPVRGGSKRSVKVPPVTSTADGSCRVPAAVRATKPSPAGCGVPVNVSVTTSTGAATTTPSAGSDDTKSVCAWAAPGSAITAANSTTNTAHVRTHADGTNRVGPDGGRSAAR